MTTLATPGTVPAHRTPRVRPVTFGRLLAAERVKLRTLRSTWWALAVGVLLVPLFAVTRMVSIAQVPEAVGSGTLVGAVYVTSGVALTQLVFCTLGVLSVAGEYGTGQIRSTFTAVPHRVAALAAKLVVTVGAVLVASLVAVALAWAGSSPWFERTGMSIDPTSAQDARLLLGVPLYLGAATALAFGIAALVRSSAAGIAIVLGLLLVVENGLGLIPWEPIQTAAAFLPGSAGSRLLQSDAVGSVITTSGVTTLGPWQGYAVMLAWVAAVLVAAAVLVRRRDA